jgi:phosphomannomutase
VSQWRSTLKVGVSGVRGVVGQSLTVPLVSAFAASFGSYVGRGRVVVGRDTRPTGQMLEHAVSAGLLAVGCEPLVAGVLPTPTLLIQVAEQNARGGIGITASHNPPEWNALKFIGPAGLFFSATEATELVDVYNQEAAEFVPEGEHRRAEKIDDAFAVHERRIHKAVDVAAVRRARLRVAVDCCNGAGAPYTRGFLEALGCEVAALNDSADGIFRRGPEPVPDNLKDLGACVREHGCALGFAQDPDGDRLALVDSRGEPLGENATLVVAVAHVLSSRPGPVVVNLATSKAVEAVARSAGCEVFYSRIGEVNVAQEMLRRSAVVGGEGNGGVMWPAVHLCRDSFSAMALVLEAVAKQGASFDDLVAKLPRYATANRKVESSSEAAQRAVRALRERFADQNPNTLDGIRIDWDDRWVLVRPSNTEPILRVQAEAPDPAAAEALAEEFVETCTAVV